MSTAKPDTQDSSQLSSKALITMLSVGLVVLTLSTVVWYIG